VTAPTTSPLDGGEDAHDHDALLSLAQVSIGGLIRASKVVHHRSRGWTAKRGVGFDGAWAGWAAPVHKICAPSR
jgi:hypothetical protein